MLNTREKSWKWFYSEWSFLKTRGLTNYLKRTYSDTEVLATKKKILMAPSPPPHLPPGASWAQRKAQLGLFEPHLKTTLESTEFSPKKTDKICQKSLGLIKIIQNHCLLMKPTNHFSEDSPHLSFEDSFGPLLWTSFRPPLYPAARAPCHFSRHLAVAKLARSRRLKSSETGIARGFSSGKFVKGKAPEFIGCFVGVGGKPQSFLAFVLIGFQFCLALLFLKRS